MIPLITEERGGDQDYGYQFQWPLDSHMLSTGHNVFYNTGILTQNPESPVSYSKPPSSGNLKKYIRLKKTIIRGAWVAQ